MSTDYKGRILIADAINRFLAGAIDNRALDDAIHSFTTQDRMCHEIRGQLWLCYDDIRRYFNTGKDALSVDNEAMLRRWECLLRTDTNWVDIQPSPPQRWWTPYWEKFILSRSKPKLKFKENPYWPFLDLQVWEEFIIQKCNVNVNVNAMKTK